jgi:hypothetical protein
MPWRMLSRPQVAKFIVPDWGDEVNSGIWLSYLPARQAPKAALPMLV